MKGDLDVIQLSNANQPCSFSRCLTSMFKVSLIIVFVAFLTACNSGSGGDNGINDDPNDKLGEDNEVTITIGASVLLDGNVDEALLDEDTIVSWTLLEVPDGSSITGVDNPSALRVEIIPDASGTYKFSLLINDSDPILVTLIVEEDLPDATAPQANAGNDQTILLGSEVTFNGSANVNDVSYQWQLQSAPDSSAITIDSLSDVNIANPIFTPDVEGDYVFTLIVTKHELSSEPAQVKITAQITNTAPTANAGSDQTASVGTAVTLDGSNSYDDVATLLNYDWSMDSRPESSNATLNLPKTVNPTFTADVAGEYVFSLIVHDGITASLNSDSVIILVRENNVAPVANAGPDQNVLTGETATLDGSGSSDLDNDTLNYQWALTDAPNGSATSLSSTTIQKPTFTPDVEGSYIFTLIVNDGITNSEIATVSIDAVKPNAIPDAEAGPDKNALTGQLVTLDGSDSSDSDADPLSYTWSIVGTPAGANITLSGAQTSSPNFTPDIEGTYEFSLIVSDGIDNSTADTVKISATEPNTAPIANAGTNRTVSLNTLVELDGSLSTDAEQNTLSFHWSIIEKPHNSTAQLDNAEAEKPTFTTDKFGHYEIALTVNDGFVDSRTTIITITVINLPPVADAGKDKFIKANQTIQLNAGGSYDPEDYELTYSWSVINSPVDSTFSLPNPSLSVTDFSANLEGSYEILLSVTDNNASSHEATIIVTVVDKYEGEINAPKLLTYSADFSHSGFVEKVSSYYKVDGLLENTHYHIYLSDLTDNVDLSVYDENTFTTPICESKNSFQRHENCTGKSSSISGSLYIEVNGNLAHDFATYTINITPVISEGSSTAPKEIALNTPYLGTIELIPSVYKIKNINTTDYVVGLKDLTGNLRLDVYYDPNFNSVKCRETSDQLSNLLCSIEPPASTNSVYVRVVQSNVLTPKSFELLVSEGSAFSPQGTNSPVNLPYTGSLLLHEDGSVDTNTSFYQVTGLTIGTDYYLRFINLNYNVYFEVQDANDNPMTENNFPKQVTFTATTETIKIQVHGDETSAGGEFSFSLNDSSETAITEGDITAPVALAYDPESELLIHSGSVDTANSYYVISNLPANEKLNFSIKELTDNADLFIYSDANFSNLVCESVEYDFSDEKCAITPSVESSVYYVRIGGGRTSKGAFYELSVAPPLYKSQGTAASPFALEASVVSSDGYAGSVDNDNSYYVINNLQAAQNYLISLNQPIHDVDLYVYDTSNFDVEPVCKSEEWDDFFEENCIATTTSSSLWIRVSGFWSVEGATFILKATEQ